MKDNAKREGFIGFVVAVVVGGGGGGGGGCGGGGGGGGIHCSGFKHVMTPKL